MNRTQREAAKRSSEARKANRANLKEQSIQQQEERDRKVQLQIQRDNNNKSKLNADDFLSPFWRTIEKKASKLLDREYKPFVSALIGMTQQRDIKDWIPKGKGKQTLFISLCEHLLAKYSMPKFLWSGFWEPDAQKLRPIIERIAKGDSLAKMCQTGEFPLPLTKKQCHTFLTTSSEWSFMMALRRVQIMSHGGNARLLKAWMQRDIGQRLQNNADEQFWDSVLAWFCKNPMLDLNQLGPLIDYIVYRRREDREFSMKGRSVMAMLRAMNDWHGELTRRRQYEEHNYNPSGFKMGRWEVTKHERTGNLYQIWRIEEILSSKELHAEGRAHHHCVASYGSSIRAGNVSIWSLSCNNEKLITIEVRNTACKIVQARGRYNRQTTAEEFKYLTKWANENGLQIQLGFW
jgi:hypothetical protein